MQMLKACWRDVHQIRLLDGEALSTELVEHCLHVDGIPDHDGIGE
jgi:hypothetical protein